MTDMYSRVFSNVAMLFSEELPRRGAEDDGTHEDRFPLARRSAVSWYIALVARLTADTLALARRRGDITDDMVESVISSTMSDWYPSTMGLVLVATLYDFAAFSPDLGLRAVVKAALTHDVQCALMHPISAQ